MNVGTNIAAGFCERTGDRMECAVSPQVIIFAADSRAYLYKNTVQNPECETEVTEPTYDDTTVSLLTKNSYHSKNITDDCRS